MLKILTKGKNVLMKDILGLLRIQKMPTRREITGKAKLEKRIQW